MMKRNYTAPCKIPHLFKWTKTLETVIHFELDPSTPKRILTARLKFLKDLTYSNTTAS
jgi:hypothetical protein